MNVRERFNPVLMAANTSYVVRGPSMGGFLAKTSGTITVTATDARGNGSTNFVNAVPVTAGAYTPIPLEFPAGAGGTVTLADGASGTLFV